MIRPIRRFVKQTTDNLSQLVASADQAFQQQHDLPDSTVSDAAPDPGVIDPAISQPTATVSEPVSVLSEVESPPPPTTSDGPTLDPEGQAKLDAKRKRNALNNRNYRARKKLRAQEGAPEPCMAQLADVKDLWSKLHDKHPAKAVGLEVINYLLKSNTIHQYVVPQKFPLKTKPTAAEVLQDLQGHKKFYNAITGDGKTKVELLDFELGWAAMGDYGDPAEGRHTPYVATDVLSSQSGTGISSCFSGLPDDLTESDVFLRTNDDGTNHLTSVVSPAGTINVPSINSCGMSQLFLVTYGLRLVFWWATDEEIMDSYAKLGGSAKLVNLPNALKKWSGMQWSILRPGDYLVGPPGVVTASLSPLNSVVTAWSFGREEPLVGGDLQKTVKWELELVERRLSQPQTEHEPPSRLAEPLLDAAEVWKKWAKNVAGLSEEAQETLNSLHKEVTLKLKNVKKDKKYV